MKNALRQVAKKLLPNPQPIMGPTNESLDQVNEAVNFDSETIFIAVPKTGTTSVRQQLSSKGKALINDPHLNILQVREALYVFLLINALGQNRTFPTQAQASDADLRARSREIFDRCFKFSSVRNPWARAISLYSRYEGVTSKEAISFEAFCEQHLYASDTCIHPTQHQNQLDWLTDESGTVLMDYVYKVEEFEPAIAEIRDRTNGRIQLAYNEANKNPRSQSTSYRDLYSDHTRNLIAQRFEKDIDFFKYTF